MVCGCGSSIKILPSLKDGQKMAIYLNVVMYWYSNEQKNAVAIRCKCQRLRCRVIQEKLKQKDEMEAGHRSDSNSRRPHPACEHTHWDSQRWKQTIFPREQIANRTTEKTEGLKAHR